MTLFFVQTHFHRFNFFGAVNILTIMHYMVMTVFNSAVPLIPLHPILKGYLLYW
jgi:hypothetical protein